MKELVIESDFDETATMYYKWLDEKKLETWRNIEGFDRYEVSNMGMIRIKKNGRIMKFCSQVDYYQVTLKNSQKRKTFKVHRIVALAFINNSDPIKKIEVDHINRDIYNNRVVNLRWCTSKQNMKYYQETVVYKGKPILQLDLLGTFVKEWNNVREILGAYPNYKYDCLLKCLTGGLDKLYGYTWEYKEKKIEPKLEPDEEFKTIGKYRKYNFSNFEVSNYGKIRNIKRNNFLKMRKETDGYISVCLYDNIFKEQQIKVHRLVALSFVKGRTIERDCVNHIDKNKENNHYKNLEWVTNQENIEHACNKAVNQYTLDNVFIQSFKSLKKAVEFNQVNKNGHVLISRCCRGKVKKAYGYKWKYEIL